MYETFYGLTARPFELTPDSRYLFLTPQHTEALAHLEYGLTGRKGITLLIGEVGTGKTTVLQSALGRSRQAHVLCAHLSNPTLSRDEFYQFVATEFGLSSQAAGSKAQFLIELKQLVEKRHNNGEVTALIVDEAQSLPLDLLEEIRLLANLESENSKLLQVVLVGQPELAARLNEPELRQLKQRIALRCTLAPMSLRETAAYIAGRIRIAGGDAAKLFTREAVYEIFEWSQGVPRTVSVICDNALVSGFALGIRPVDRGIVREVCHDFDMESTTDQQSNLPGMSAGSEERPAPETAAEAAEAGTPPVPVQSSSARERRLFSMFGVRRSRSRA